MAGKEEAAKWTMRPRAAAESTKDAVAGDHGPATRFPSKRKAVSRSSSKKGEQRVCAAAGAGEPSSFHPQRREAKLPSQGKQAVGGSKGTRRLTKRELRGIIALKPEPFPEDDYLDGLAGSFPPEWIEQKKREHAEDAEYFGKMDEVYETFRKQVISGLKQEGCFKVDKDFLAGKEKIKGYVSKRFANMDISEIRRRFSTPEEEQDDGYNPYVRDKDDALVSDGDDDSDEDGDDSS